MPADPRPHVVRDVTAGRVVVAELEYATNPWTRFRGLMLRRNPQPDGGLLIRPGGSIHMLFMRFAIDAVFIDRNGVVTRVWRNVRPWIGIAWGGRGSHSVLELAVGQAHGVEVGHQLEFV